ncbi:cell filamentation protein Fic [Scytonema hofmannii PCC 7110]|uniref:Cell filamentation protein Fic n=1 Tax=Scytonema hofmannii PCC 7110 TaxID=128403 RepID=A0A139WXS4_9CYAN|nr:Fic family protein [Scytonema hofmannii]KYC37245.1 cell filamentation protein Fic [Scytonema hofmannii PCC 7110]
MESFEPGFIEHQPISQNLLRTIRLIGEYKGKQELFKEQSPQVLETLRQASIIQSTESSNRIEGITVPLERIKELVAEKTTPRDRSEQEIAGYRDVLNTIHSSYAHIPFTPGVVLQLHRDLYQFTVGEGGRWKSVDNVISATYPDGTKIVRFEPVKAVATPLAMASLHERFNTLWQSEEIEPLLLIPTYVLDFLCIHPFSDGNGRMARLLTLLLLYKAGYEAGRFISLERIVERTKESYYDTLYQSSQSWHTGKHNLSPWWEYFLGVVVLSAYREFEERVGLVSSAKGAKTAMVLGAVNNIPGDFSIKDLQERCPTVGIDLIRRILRQERNAGRMECLGRGPDARWRKK